MDTFACSSWYHFRFASPHDETAPFDRDKAEYWLPVDLYVGGAEHAVMHLLYARFFCKVAQDAGYVSFGEPYARLRNQGMIQAEDGQKMSKSKGNVITPDSVVEKYGADALRVYELFIAPFEQSVAWSDRGVQGTYRFLGRFWNLVNEVVEAQGSGVAADEAEAEKGRQVLRTLNKTIRKVTRDMDTFRFNTAVSALMELQNEVLDVWTGARGALTLAQWREVVTDMTLLVAPMAPHIAEEVWELLGHGEHGAGRAVARLGRRARRRRGRDGRRAGERQAARPPRGAGGRGEGRRARPGARGGERRALPGGQAGRQGDLRARQARELRGAVGRRRSGGRPPAWPARRL